MAGWALRTLGVFAIGTMALTIGACQSESVTQEPVPAAISPAPVKQEPARKASPAPDRKASAAKPAVAKAKSPTSSVPAATPAIQLVSSPAYQQALNKAESAISISASAQSPEDWSLVSNQWKDAIALMKKVPSNDPNRKEAIRQLDRMESGLSKAQQKIEMLTKPTGTAVARDSWLGRTSSSESEIRKGIYRAPIKRYSGGIPVVDVMFNGQASFEMMVDTGASGTMITENMAQTLQVKPIGAVEAMTPSGRTRFNVGYLDSMSVGGGTLNSFPVAIGPVALLGHDFFGDCNISIKRDQNVVEFSQCTS